jgi:hypothetical protein
VFHIFSLDLTVFNLFFLLCKYFSLSFSASKPATLIFTLLLAGFNFFVRKREKFMALERSALSIHERDL